LQLREELAGKLLQQRALFPRHEVTLSLQNLLLPLGTELQARKQRLS